MIKERSELTTKPREIDLSGPEGNAFNLIGIAVSIAKELKRNGIPIDIEKIKEEMMSGDYNNLITVMDREFGEYIILYK